MGHLFPVRVYYEDTDLAGIVYYANYLKFIERARSEWVRDLGLDQGQMRAEGVVFAVRRLEADYVKPARFDDLLQVQTHAVAVSAARMVLRQEVRRDGDLVFSAGVTLVCLGPEGRPQRLPALLRLVVPEPGI